MTETIYTTHDQTLWDLAIQAYNSIEGVFEVMDANGFDSLDQLPESGKTIVLDSSLIFKNKFENRQLNEQSETVYSAIVQHDQSLWDMCLQEYGSIEQFFNLVNDNQELGTIEPELAPGYKLTIQNDFDGDYAAMKYFRGKLNVVTGSGKRRGGIGYMQIGKTFRVS